MAEDEFEMIAQTLHGLEDVLAKELADLGAASIATHNRAVRFTGDTELLYKANLCLHSALRILVPIASFHVRMNMSCMVPSTICNGRISWKCRTPWPCIAA